MPKERPAYCRLISLLAFVWNATYHIALLSDKLQVLCMYMSAHTISHELATLHKVHSVGKWLITCSKVSMKFDWKEIFPETGQNLKSSRVKETTGQCCSPVRWRLMQTLRSYPSKPLKLEQKLKLLIFLNFLLIFLNFSKSVFYRTL